jgi:hypothetical protein
MSLWPSGSGWRHSAKWTCTLHQQVRSQSYAPDMRSPSNLPNRRFVPSRRRFGSSRPICRASACRP